MFSDDGDGVADEALLRRAMREIARLGGVLSEHAEDRRLTAGGHLHEGSISAQLGLQGLPAAGEEGMVARDLALVRQTGCRYHVQHVSTAGTVQLVRRAKEEGLPVTAEATPHHLTFDHRELLSLDPDFKMYPPLRTPEDVAAVREALASGVIDAVATDHAPHSAEESALSYEQAPRGVIGLETAVGAVLEALRPDPATLFDRMSVRPARIGGTPDHGRPVAPGNPAHLVVIDPTAEWVVERFASRSVNSPWKGRRMRGRVIATIHAGVPTHRVDR
jgi:dihydroorotase